MPYGLGVIGVSVSVAAGMGVGGSVVSVGGAVVRVGSDVSDGNVGMIVTPGVGVRIGMFGTQSR